MSILFDIGTDLKYRKEFRKLKRQKYKSFLPNQKLEGRTRERTPLLPTLSYLPSDHPEMSQLIVILYFLHTLNSYFLLICLISLSILIFILYIFGNMDFHLFIIFRHPPFAVRRPLSAIRRPFPCFTAPAMRSLTNSFSYTFFYSTYKLSLFFCKK